MNSLGKNYLAALFVFAVVLAVLLYEREVALDGMAKANGVAHAQPQESATSVETSGQIDNLTPPPATLTPPALPSLDVTPPAGSGS